MASRTWTALLERVKAVENRQADNEIERYDAMARKRDAAIVESLDRAAISWVPVPLGTVVERQPVLGYGTFSFDASYPTGGEVVAPPIPGLITMLVSPVNSGGALYTFEYALGTTKLKAFSGGVEVADTTDLAALADLPYISVGVAADDHEAYRAAGSVRLLKAEFSVGVALTASAANYWSLTLRHRKSGQTTGEKVGATYETNDRTLAVQDPVSLYDDALGLAMTDGERLALYLTETGTPEALEDLVLWLLVQRIVR